MIQSKWQEKPSELTNDPFKIFVIKFRFITMETGKNERYKARFHLFQQTKEGVRAAPWFAITSQISNNDYLRRASGGKCDSSPCWWLPGPLVTDSPDPQYNTLLAVALHLKRLPECMAARVVNDISWSAVWLSTLLAQPNLRHLLKFTSYHVICIEQSHGNYKPTRHTPEDIFPTNHQ